MKWSLVLCLVVVVVVADRASAFFVQGRQSHGRRTTTPLAAAVVNINENAPRDMTALEEWATACGVGRIEGFALQPNTGDDGGSNDWSVVTTQPIAGGSAVLRIPAEMILSAARVRQELNVQDALDQLGRLGAADQANEFCLLAKILTEYEQGDRSPWFPWLNSLSRLYFNAVSMTDFCHECLPPLVFSLSRTERIKLDNFKAAIQKVPSLTPATKANDALLKWAFNVVTTRCHENKIAPMADMFNHGTDTEIDIQYDEEGNCYAFANQDVPAGSPLRMSYGSPTNPSRLFATYGFLDETSPATFCKIMNIQPTPELLNLGLDFTRMLFFKDSGGISQEVWDVMLYQILNSNKAAQKAFYEAHMAGDDETKQNFHLRYALETSTALKNHVDTFLEQLDLLSAKTVGKSVEQHPRIPVILKHNAFVKSTFLKVKAGLDPIVAQAAGELVRA